MKKRITSALMVLILTLSLVSCGATKQTNEAEEATTASQIIETEEEAFEPTPLVIETEDEEAPLGPYQGTVTIITPYDEEECWAGLIMIYKDGPGIRVYVMDAVESNFNELF